jgi:ParB family chromosome partitioning protein
VSQFLDTFAELNAAFGQDDGVVVLPIDQVVEDPNQPREHFDDAELEQLAGSVRRKGVLQPIVVRPPGADGRYMIRFGARRYRAARRAGLAEIKAVVRGGDAGEADLLIEQVIENDQRADLTTAERAKTVARLLDLGLSQADIARELDRPKDDIAMLAAVRKMPEALQALAASLGHRTLYELYGAWRADEEKAQAWLAGRSPEVITQAEARALAARLKALKTSTTSPRPKAPIGPAPEARDPVATPSPSPDGSASVTAAPSAATRVVEVAVDGRVGELLLDRDPPSSSEAWVQFGQTGRPARVALADLTIARIGRVGGDGLAVAGGG